MKTTFRLQRVSAYLYIIVSMIAPSSGYLSVKIVRVAVVAAILFIFLQNKTIIFPRREAVYYVVWSVMFVTYCGIGTLHAYSEGTSISFLSTLIYVFVIDLLIYIYLFSYIDIYGFIISLVIGATLSSFDCYLRYGLLAFLSARRAGNISGNSIGQFTAFACVLLIYLLADSPKKPQLSREKIIWILLFVLNVAFMILSGSRKAILYFFIPIAVGIILNSRSPLIFIRNIALAVCAAIAGYYLLMHVPALYDTIGHRIETMLNGFLGSGTTDASTKTRIGLINLGMTLFRQRPWTGYGLNAYQLLNYERTQSWYYAHNNYVELLVDCGVIGTVIYYSLHIFVLLKAWLNRNLYGPKEHLFVGIIVAVLVCDYGMVSYYDIFTQALTMVAVIIIIRPDLSTRKKNISEIYDKRSSKKSGEAFVLGN